MLRYFGKSINLSATTLEPHKFFILRFQQYCSSKHVNQDSFTVGYLINEFGFSREKAVSASKRLHFQNGDKPDVVVSFLKNQGFTHTQIQRLISDYSRILSCRPETTLLPKIDFYRSKGVASTDLAKMIVLNPQLLRRSLKQYIIPSFNVLRGLIGSDEGVVVLLKGYSMVFSHVENRIKPSIEILRGAGVPDSRIASLLKYRIRTFMFRRDKLKEAIEQVQKLGIDPQSSSYSVALSVLVVVPRSKLDKKMEAYKRWGCSEDEVLTTFKVQPRIMSISEGKIHANMNFCVNEMGWQSSDVMRCYNLLTYSLNKRIIPRWSVYQELLSKSLVKEEGKSATMFYLSDHLFLDRYVYRYKSEAPLLLKRYREKFEASK